MLLSLEANKCLRTSCISGSIDDPVNNEDEASLTLKEMFVILLTAVGGTGTGRPWTGLPAVALRAKYTQLTGLVFHTIQIV